MDEELEAGVVGEPEETLRPRDLEPERPVFLAGDESMELDRVKGAPHVVDKARDVVFYGLWDVLSFFPLGNPLLANFSLLQIKPLFEYLGHVDFRVAAELDYRVGVDALDVTGHVSQVLLRHEVGLVDEDEIGDFQLIDHQLSNCRLLFCIYFLLAFDPSSPLPFVRSALLVLLHHQLITDELFFEVFCIDHCDHGVDHRVFLDSGGVSEGLGDGEGRGDSGGLNDQILKSLGIRQFLDLLDHIFLERAADAAIADLHDVLCLLHAKVLILDEVKIDVELADVVEDHRHLHRSAVGQDVLHEGGLARTQEPRQDDYLQHSFCYYDPQQHPIDFNCSAAGLPVWATPHELPHLTFSFILPPILAFGGSAGADRIDRG